MQRSKRKINVREKGITLIALVVTILIMLILAGVTIRFGLADHGVVKEAKETVNIYVESQEREQEDLENLRNTIKANRRTESDKTTTTDKTPNSIEGEGTESSPYLIQSIEDLAIMAYNCRKDLNGEYYKNREKNYITLDCSLDFNNKNSYLEYDRTSLIVNGEYVFGSETNTVGMKDYYNQNGFNGFEYIENCNFNGKNNTIYNLFLNNTSSLFGSYFMELGKVENLNITGEMIINDLNGTINVGTICGSFGYYHVSTIENCKSTMNITIKNCNDNIYVRRNSR